MDLCAVLQRADLPQFATAAAAAADLGELAALALTDPGRVRAWLKAELGVVKLGHRERIINALRRGPFSATALVAVDENDAETAGAAGPGSRTGVFIGMRHGAGRRQAAGTRHEPTRANRSLTTVDRTDGPALRQPRIDRTAQGQKR